MKPGWNPDSASRSGGTPTPPPLDGHGSYGEFPNRTLRRGLRLARATNAPLRAIEALQSNQQQPRQRASGPSHWSKVLCGHYADI